MLKDIASDKTHQTGKNDSSVHKPGFPMKGYACNLIERKIIWIIIDSVISTRSKENVEVIFSRGTRDLIKIVC